MPSLSPWLLMRVLTYLCLSSTLFSLCLLQPVHSARVLVFGDSMDRNMIQSKCEMELDLGRSVDRSEFDWGREREERDYPNEFTTAKQDPRYLQCAVNKNHSLSYAQFFGSRAQGPYWQDVSSWADAKHAHSVLVDTAPKMNATYKMYMELYGHPDKLVLAFATWDIAAAFPESIFGASGKHFFQHHMVFGKDTALAARFNASVTEYEANLRERIMQALQLASSSTNALGTKVWLRTQPWNLLQNVLCATINAITRRLAKEYGLGLFDFDAWAWDKVDDEAVSGVHSLETSRVESMFADYTHVGPAHSGMASEVMLDVRYSGWITLPRGEGDRPIMNGAYLDDSIPLWEQGVQVYLLALDDGRDISTRKQVAENAFLFDPINLMRHSGLTEKMLLVAKLGTGDVYRVKAAWLNAVPEGPPLPNFDHCRYLRADAGKGRVTIYVRQSEYFRRLGYQPPLPRLMPLLDAGFVAHFQDTIGAGFGTKTEFFGRHSHLHLRRGRRLQTSDTAHMHHIHEHICRDFPLHVWSLLPYAMSRWFMHGSVYLGNELKDFDWWRIGIKDEKLFNNGTLLLLRMNSQSQVFALRNGVRKPVNSLVEMKSMGREWTDVMVIPYSRMKAICDTFVCPGGVY